MEFADKETGYLLSKIDDGHKPGGSDVDTFLAKNVDKVSAGFVSIFDNLLSEEWCNRIYDYAYNKRPWGVYVTSKDALDMSINTSELYKTNPERALGIEAVRALVYQRGAGILGSDASDRVHGTAIWCLSSGVSNSVSYHIDYAELYRYETNIIHPPLYAGTCHVSPFDVGEMSGGDFMVNTGGLDHYCKFGYKGKLQSADALTSDLENGDWLRIKYKSNRGILHDGDFPHLSTPVSHIPDGKKRVILGFNCFSGAVSACCQRAPEHSDAFNRTVKLYQAVAAATGCRDMSPKYSSTEDDSPSSLTESSQKSQGEEAKTTNSKGKMSVKEIMKNPALARLLVLAAKKVKEEEKRNNSNIEATDTSTEKDTSKSI
jgi:hypothetical protein